MNPPSSESGKSLQLMTKAPDRYQVKDIAKLTVSQFQKLIPDTIPSLIQEDIAYYFNYLKNNRNKNSLEQWEQGSGCTDSANSWKAENYRPIFSYLYYDRITDGLFLPLLLKKIEATINRSDELSIEEFNRLCRLSIVGFRPAIDSIDLKILHVLSKEPSLVVQTISERINHSYATVYNHLQKLKARMGLRITTRINWAKLGIQRVFLISNNVALLNQFKDYKSYLDGQASFLWGEAFHLRYYLLSEDNRSKLLNDYNALSASEKNQLSFSELRASPISEYNFESYDLKEQRWDFDFATSYMVLNANLQKSVGLFIDIFPPKEQYNLTDSEKQIVSGLVGNFTLTQKEIADLLGIHAPNLSIMKTKLQNDNIIGPQLMVNTFLPLNQVLWCSSAKEHVIDSLIYLLQKLPFANISPVKTIINSKEYQLICFLTMDDYLYSSLITFLMELLRNKSISDFRLGLTVDMYFGMSKMADILDLDK